MCCIVIAGCYKGLLLVNSCNSGDKYNCQNNKCFFAVIQYSFLSYWMVSSTVTDKKACNFSSTALRRCAWVIIQLTKSRIKPCIVHLYASDQIIPVFWTICNRKLGRSLGTRLGFSIIAQPFSLHPYTVLVCMLDSITIFCFIIQVMTVEDAIPKLQQLSLASKGN